MSNKDNSTEQSTSNITQLLNSFNQFNKLLRNTTMIKTADTEDIKTIFKLGNFIEKSSEYLAKQGTMEELLKLVTQETITDRTSIVDYFHACDYLLKDFFRCENVPEGTLDIAIRMYTAMFPRQRFQQVLNDLLMYSNNSECLADFINILPKAKINEIEFHFHLGNWNQLYKSNIESFKHEVQERLSIYNLENNLPNFLGMLSLTNISGTEKLVQTTILELILEKMLDRSLLSNSFWYTLLQKINVKLLSSVCQNFIDFFNSLFNFIIYLGSMMDREGNIWKSDPNKSICPAINYYDLLVVVKYINKSNRKVVVDKLAQAKADTGSEIWDQIRDELNCLFLKC